MNDTSNESVDPSSSTPEANSAARQDRAIEKSGDDALDRAPFVESLIRAVVHTDRDLHGKVVGRCSTGFVVGLTGEWGLGKSSVLNLVKEQLDSYEHVAVAAINPWLFNNRDDLLKGYFNALRDALGKTLKERARDVQTQLEKYKGAIGVGGTVAAAAIDLHGGSGVASSFWKQKGKPIVDKITKAVDQSPDQERKILETKLKAAKIAVVVLIDELDRVEDDEVRAVAQLVKAVGDIKGISYLVAYDPKRVAQALGRGSDAAERQTSGEAYLEKIVQFAVPLRPLFEEDARALLSAALRDNGANLPAAENEYQIAILNELIRVVRTPREIKRLIGAFGVLEEIVRGEICPYDILGYSWLATKAPALRDAIARDLETIVNDPGEMELYRRVLARGTNGKKQENLADLLGAAAAPHESMLKLLFPRFGEDDKTDGGNRIGKRRNLVRLLYLGNPPGMMPRTEIERLWSINSIEHSMQAIRPLLAAERVSGILDRLSDILTQLAPQFDLVFWPALGRSLVRQHDWITGPESLGSLVDDAGERLWQFGRSGEGNAERVRMVFNSLTANGDLLIAPWLLRKHLFAHNMTSHPSTSGGHFIFTKVETTAYLESELPRYAQAVIDGTLLKRLPDSEALYAILNANCWTGQLRKSMTDQLNHIDAIATFAALTVPPGYVSEKTTMNEIMDGDVVLERLVEIAKNGELPTDPWLRASVTRLVATLRGHDTHFLRDYADDKYIVDGLPDPT